MIYVHTVVRVRPPMLSFPHRSQTRPLQFLYTPTRLLIVTRSIIHMTSSEGVRAKRNYLLRPLRHVKRALPQLSNRGHLFIITRRLTPGLIRHRTRPCCVAQVLSPLELDRAECETRQPRPSL